MDLVAQRHGRVNSLDIMTLPLHEQNFFRADLWLCGVSLAVFDAFWWHGIARLQHACGVKTILTDMRHGKDAAFSVSSLTLYGWVLNKTDMNRQDIQHSY